MRLHSTSVLRQPFFLNFFSSRMLSGTAFQMVSVAIGWQMYALTHNAFSLGFVGLAQFLPMAALTLIVGHVADRFDRRWVVFVALLVESAVTALLLAGTVAHDLRQSTILIAAGLVGACRAFEGPASSALLPQLVPMDMISRAISWVTSAGQTSMIVGPAIGGLLYTVGAAYVYGISCIAVFVGAVLTAFIRTERTTRELKGVSLDSLFSGLVFVFRHPVILGTISLDLFAVLLGGATALLPIFAQSILHTGPFALGLMRTAPAVGALLMSIYFGYFPLRRAIGPTLFAALGVFGLSTMLFAVSKTLWLSLLALFLIGASDLVSVVIRSSLVQLQTPDAMRGRVNAVNSLFVGTSNQLGEFESGLVAGFIGAVPAALLGGIGTLVIAALWMVLFPSIRRIRSLSGAEET